MGNCRPHRAQRRIRTFLPIQNLPNTTTKAAFSYQELATAATLTKEPFSKNFSQVFSTELHPNSQVRPNKQEHRMLNRSNAEEARKERAIGANHSFCSPLPATSPQEKHTNYVSQYRLHFESPAERKDKSLLNLTAGSYNQNPEEAVKVSTRLVGEFGKEAADEKERTPVQRSWVPPKDKSLIFGARESVEQFKKSSVPANDIQTSLNTNIGIHNIHPKDVGDNYFGHRLSEITRNMNRSPCQR